ncbi:MAG: glutamate synthase subunit beta [Candidatus Omnitrophica bacterium]|nr:glutamate synthase subunit beta [Candidatus Omnitrophota bacterium]
MGDIKGFLKVKRQHAEYRPVCERLSDFCEINLPPKKSHSQEQSSRCMDCGVPFCHWGCPVGNLIPEWNDLVSRGQWGKAFQLLDATNNLPEITGRVCPATCEYACVLGINDDPVTIRENELGIIEYAFSHRLIKPRPPKKRTGKTIAVVGSGPAGISCAQQLNRAGHKIVVFEKDKKPGGILRYGIPDFKLEKKILDRRIALLKKEGIVFENGIEVGRDYSVAKLHKEFDAICLTGGCRTPRDLKIEGRDLKGIHFAMEYLIQSNSRIEGTKVSPDVLIDAKNKRVVVIGGGDTGADCMGVAHRQKASCITQIELLDQPATCRTDDFPWPKYPILLKTSSSHEEGGERKWSVLTKKFIGEKGCVEKLSCVKVRFEKDSTGCIQMKEESGSNFQIEADLVVLALGFVAPQKEGLLDNLKVELDARGNVKTDASYMTSVKGVFSAGDMRRGQSLIVWAISEGRRAAHQIDSYLMGTSVLPSL